MPLTLKFLVPILLTLHKPVCDRQTEGALWPENATAQSRMPLEVCSYRRWKYRWQYRWEPATVDYSRLVKSFSKKTTTF